MILREKISHLTILCFLLCKILIEQTFTYRINDFNFNDFSPKLYFEESIFCVTLILVTNFYGI